MGYARRNIFRFGAPGLFGGCRQIIQYNLVTCQLRHLRSVNLFGISRQPENRDQYSFKSIQRSHHGSEKKRIAVFGCGAVGLYYGGRLLESELLQNGQSQSQIDVHFIVRSGYDLLKSKGFEISSPDGNVMFHPNMLQGKIHKFDCSSKEIGKIDWLIISLKSTSIENNSDDIKHILKQLISKTTRILLIMNGLQIEEKFAQWFNKENIFGGMAFICVNRNQPNDYKSHISINHIAFGSLLIGHYQNNTNQLSDILTLWDHSKLKNKVTATDSLLYARWSKLVWNLPFSGLSVALGGLTIDIIANDPHLRQLVDIIMTETITLANEDLKYHHNLNITATQNQLQLQNQHINSNNHTNSTLKLLDMEASKAHCWSLTDGMGAYKTSTVLDLIAGNDLEVEYIFNRPYQRALALSVLLKAKVKSVLPPDTNESYSSTSASTSTIPYGNIMYTESVCLWPHIEHLVMQVKAIQNIAMMKRKQTIIPTTTTTSSPSNGLRKWEPTFFTS
eukprot:gene9173-19006_t